MVLGVGIDLIETERIRKVFEKRGQAFLEKVFTSKEVDYAFGFKDPFTHLAARFAAKEAYYKCLGKGTLRFSEIEVQQLPTGKPYLVLHGKTRELWLSEGSPDIHLSLTHHRSSAAAVVVLEENISKARHV